MHYWLMVFKFYLLVFGNPGCTTRQCLRWQQWSECHRLGSPWSSQTTEPSLSVKQAFSHPLPAGQQNACPALKENLYFSRFLCFRYCKRSPGDFEGKPEPTKLYSQTIKPLNTLFNYMQEATEVRFQIASPPPPVGRFSRRGENAPASCARCFWIHRNALQPKVWEPLVPSSE